MTLLDINNSVPKALYDEDIAGKFPMSFGILFMGFHCGNTPACKMCASRAVKYQLIQNRLLEDGGTPDFTRGTLEGDIAASPITFYRLQCDSNGDLPVLHRPGRGPACGHPLLRWHRHFRHP